MHIRPIYLYAILCCFILSFPACSNEEDDFDGVGRLISSRNAARYEKAEQAKKKKPPKAQNQNQNKEPAQIQEKKKPEKKKVTSEMLYEEKIKIVSSSSDRTLGIGTAYLNKDGKIIQIKIKRD
ncbi:MAG: hypothetical protein K8R67_14040 [Desulfobacteraceae bacterium]|nr:hypothetical protein [Desulfobacteraceae bacterium]